MSIVARLGMPNPMPSAKPLMIAGGRVPPKFSTLWSTLQAFLTLPGQTLAMNGMKASRTTTYSLPFALAKTRTLSNFSRPCPMLPQRTPYDSLFGHYRCLVE